MGNKPKFTNARTTSARDKPTWNQARKPKNSSTQKYISSVPNAVNLYKPTRDLVHNQQQPSNANREYVPPRIFPSSVPNGQTQAIVNATSIAAQSSCTRVQISWGNCGVPGSFAQRQFLEEMAEEVAVQEGFEHAKILSTVHSNTCKGTKADAPHWVGKFGTVSGPRMIKAHIYVLPNDQRGKKRRGKRLKHLGYYERSALGNIIYQKEWKPGVKHVQR